MKLSDQYLPVHKSPPNHRQGTVQAFNSAFRPKGAEGAHYVQYQYTPTGTSLNDRIQEVSERDRTQISAMLKAQVKENPSDTISILDFGSGNGRLSGLYEALGKFSLDNKKLRVIALDTSREALNQFAIRLKQANFTEVGDHASSARDLDVGDSGYLFGEFKKDNTTIKLVHGNVDNSPEQVRELVLENNDQQKLGLTLGFDSLSFIDGQDNRAAFIKMFREITDADLLFTLPGFATEKWQPLLAEFNTRRASEAPGGVGLAKEADSFMFNFRGHHVFYKLFQRAALAADAVKAGLEGFAVSINQLWHPQRHKEQDGLADADRDSTNLYNALVDKDGHTEHLDHIFNIVDGFIQLHHKPSAEVK